MKLFMSRWFADKAMESVPELADLPPDRRHQVADECASRTALSGVGGTLTIPYLFLLAFGDDALEFFFPGAPWWVALFLYGAIALVSIPMAIRAKRAYDQHYREEVREYLRRYVHPKR